MRNALLVVLTLFMLGMSRLRSARADAGQTLRVTFIQPSIPQTMIWNTAEHEQRFAELLRLSGASA